MATITRSRSAAHADGHRAGFVRAAIVGLTLVTAYVHASLGGLLFLANAAGYVALALGMVLPGPFATFRWLVRLALLGFTSATIGAWFLFGARFALAYADKGLEVVLVGILAAELWQLDGGPGGVVVRGRELFASVVRRAERATR